MRAVRPYFMAAPSSVACSGWLLMRDGEWVSLPEALADWDYNTDLRVRASAEADLAHLHESTGMDPEAQLRWVVTWQVADVRLGGVIHTGPVSADGRLLLDSVLPAHDLGSAVDLRIRLVLAADLVGTGPGQAHMAGSILWEHVERVTLVGDLTRFPVAIIDFAKSGLDADASWTLEISPELDAHVLGGIQLLVNERDEALVRAITTGERQGDVLRGELQEGVAYRLLDHAVLLAVELSDQEWEDETLGSVLLALTNRCSGGLRELVNLRQQSLAAYQAVLAGEARRNGVGRTLS